MEKPVVYCGTCGKPVTKKNAKRFCSRECYLVAHKLEHYQAYLADNSIAYGQQNMQQYKKYFLEEQQHKCAVCGCSDV